ncbi:MAG TPA: hypothetical protein VFC18_04530 [Burkholderiales bacterium]|nr:hypothetical protein [Burkholderiales bacterium]
MPLLGFLEFGALVVGVLAVVAGEFFGLPKGMHLGVFLIGAAFAVGGLESLGTQRMCFRLSEGAGEAYAGPPAIVVGIAALMIGAGVIAGAYLLSDGLWHSTVAYLQRRPAAALAAGGVLAGCVGLFLMMNPSGRVGTAWTLLVRVPRWLLGLALVLAALASISLGAWEWLQPAAFDDFARRLPRELRWPR